jgi:hypothetical protein
MKKVLLYFICFFSLSTAFAQRQISLKDAAVYNGDSVLVCGKIAGGKYFSESKDSLTLLNVGGAYPNQLLTLVIKADARKEFTSAPETFYKDKQVCIYGRVSMYNEKPQIIIYHADQIMDALKQ